LRKLTDWLIGVPPIPLSRPHQQVSAMRLQFPISTANAHFRRSLSQFPSFPFAMDFGQAAKDPAKHALACRVIARRSRELGGNRKIFRIDLELVPDSKCVTRLMSPRWRSSPLLVALERDSFVVVYGKHHAVAKRLPGKGPMRLRSIRDRRHAHDPAGYEFDGIGWAAGRQAPRTSISRENQ